MAPTGGGPKLRRWDGRARGADAASITVEGLKQVVTRERPDGNPREFSIGARNGRGLRRHVDRPQPAVDPDERRARTAFTVGADVLTSVRHGLASRPARIIRWTCWSACRSAISSG